MNDLGLSMAYFGTNLWPFLWPGHNQSCRLFRAEFGTNFGPGLGPISGKLEWHVMA